LRKEERSIEKKVRKEKKRKKERKKKLGCLKIFDWTIFFLFDFINCFL